MITIYHNPRCSKSREALTLLEQHGAPFNVIDYLKTPLCTHAIAVLVKQLGGSARQLLREKEAEYQTLGVADPTLTEEQLVAIIAAHPRLLERPIVVVNDKAAIGRPLDNIQALLK